MKSEMRTLTFYFPSPKGKEGFDFSRNKPFPAKHSSTACLADTLSHWLSTSTAPRCALLTAKHSLLSPAGPGAQGTGGEPQTVPREGGQVTASTVLLLPHFQPLGPATFLPAIPAAQRASPAWLSPPALPEAQ